MYELRQLNSHDGYSVLATVDTLAEAVIALDADRRRFVTQLAANGEGATTAKIRHDIIQIDHSGNESLTVTSSYTPVITGTETHQQLQEMINEYEQ